MNKPKKVAKAIIKKDGKILLLKRTHVTQRYPNQWDFVGGRLEVGEKPIEVRGEIILSHEHVDFGWFEEGELGDLDLHPAVRLFFGGE
jgi:hypothetical protein